MDRCVIPQLMPGDPRRVPGVRLRSGVHLNYNRSRSPATGCSRRSAMGLSYISVPHGSRPFTHCLLCAGLMPELVVRGGISFSDMPAYQHPCFWAPFVLVGLF
jgi:CHAT domain-containing protein